MTVTDRPAPRPGPMELAAIVLSVAAAILLLGGVLFAFASADANGASASDRFRLLAQAANPFIALLASAGSGLVVHERQRGGHLGRGPQVAGSAALAIGTAVCLAVALLAVNGLLTDVAGEAGGLFKLSAVVSRLAAIALSGLGVWLSVTATPPSPPSR